MKKLYNVDAVHPVAKRVIKSNMNCDTLAILLKELEDAGYEKEKYQN